MVLVEAVLLHAARLLHAAGLLHAARACCTSMPMPMGMSRCRNGTADQAWPGHPACRRCCLGPGAGVRGSGSGLSQ